MSVTVTMVAVLRRVPTLWGPSPAPVEVATHSPPVMDALATVCD